MYRCFEEEAVTKTESRAIAAISRSIFRRFRPAYLDVCSRYVANHIHVVIHHHNRSYSLGVHDLEGFAERFVTAASIH